jgi:short-chain fatty acids transporter
VVFCTALGLAPTGEPRGVLLGKLIDGWGGGFFSLLPFTLQMAMIIIGGHTVASAPPVKRLLQRLAAVPTSAPFAVAWVTLLALASAWFNWGFSLIFSALLARAVAQNLERRGIAVDYRALAAASFLGLGSIWAQGLSGSAALQMATPGALSEALRHIVDWGSERTLASAPAVAAAGAPAWNRWGSGIIPLSHTIFLWQSLAAVAIEIVVVTLLMWRAAPTGAQAVTAQALGVSLAEPADPPPPAAETLRPGERWEHSPLLTAMFVVLGVVYLGRYLRAARAPLEAIHLNTINLMLLLLAAALHRTPARLMRAFADATQAVWGVILQFPFYGGIAGMLSASALNERIAGLFISASSRTTLPPLIALYSALLGVFVPSGGGKWLIEAPYVLTAAHRMKVHLGWMVAVYDLGEALGNLVQPFWMLPVLALLGLRARDVMGYTFLVFVFLLPVVLVLTWLLGMTLPYPL